MIIKQVKLAQALPGTSSNLIEPEKFDIKWDGTKLHAKYKSGPNAQKYASFMIFPANIAHIEYYEEVTEAPSQEQDENVVPAKGKAAKK
jgi:hypothetical protein